MALIIRKNPNAINSLNLKKIVNDCIQSALLNKLSLRSPGLLKYLQFFPTFKLCEVTNEKTLSNVYFKIKYQKKYEKFSIDEIEITGASVIKFLDFLSEKGGNEIDSVREIFQTI